MFYIIFDFCMAAIMLLFGIGFYKSGGKAAENMTKTPCVKHMEKE